MKFTPRVSATAAALCAVLLVAAWPHRANAALIPGTPLDGTNPGTAIVFPGNVALVGVYPYSVAGDLSDADRARRDIVFLTPVSGSSALYEDRSNWAAVARYFSPADPDGSKGTDATEESGFLATDSPAGPATNFSAFTLFPNVYYVNAGLINPDEVVAILTVFGPAGAIIPGQTALMQVDVEGIAAPEPASVGLLGIGGALLLSRRRRKFSFSL